MGFHYSKGQFQSAFNQDRIGYETKSDSTINPSDFVVAIQEPLLYQISVQVVFHLG